MNILNIAALAFILALSSCAVLKAPYEPEQTTTPFAIDFYYGDSTYQGLFYPQQIFVNGKMNTENDSLVFIHPESTSPGIPQDTTKIELTLKKGFSRDILTGANIWNQAGTKWSFEKSEILDSTVNITFMAPSALSIFKMDSAGRVTVSIPRQQLIFQLPAAK